MLPKLNLQAYTLTDINNAMWAGRVVTVHEKTLSYKGWRGDGYSIVDPNTGAGAYLINGGANGAMFAIFGAWISCLIVLTIVGGITGALATGGISNSKQICYNSIQVNQGTKNPWHTL